MIVVECNPGERERDRLLQSRTRERNDEANAQEQNSRSANVKFDISIRHRQSIRRYQDEESMTMRSLISIQRLSRRALGRCSVRSLSCAWNGSAIGIDEGSASQGAQSSSRSYGSLPFDFDGSIARTSTLVDNTGSSVATTLGFLPEICIEEDDDGG
uniref:Uncharacterized protein n=1 Tax=Craspedostauros australis TaxID=1486917 RepID=A0A7R9WR24_9STRA|mmetsp:Transcript_168/g.422  ORF Transcript_168/g.422 Transcript_168/m.422 type:complete len:157 (+) Transcript_168:72-542(+)